MAGGGSAAVIIERQIDRLAWYWFALAIGLAGYAAFYFFRSYFKEDVHVKLLRSLRNQEVWAQIAGTQIRLARLYTFDDGSCQVVDHEDYATWFESNARAEQRLREDGYSRVSELIEAGRLPRGFRVRGERLRNVRGLRPGMDREFIESLGPERENVRCAHAGCTQGAIQMSKLCRRHHFEKVAGRPYIY